jgi:hypothetical protein
LKLSRGWALCTLPSSSLLHSPPPLLSSFLSFYNDCCYIAHNATLLTHLYRQDHRWKTDTSFGFVDFIPRFRYALPPSPPPFLLSSAPLARAIGERVLQGHVEEQKNILLNLLARVNIRIPEADEEEAGVVTGGGDSAAEDSSSGSNNEEAAGILVKQLGKLKTQWQVSLLFPLSL